VRETRKQEEKTIWGRYARWQDAVNKIKDCYDRQVLVAIAPL